MRLRTSAKKDQILPIEMSIKNMLLLYLKRFLNVVGIFALSYLVLSVLLLGFVKIPYNIWISVGVIISLATTFIALNKLPRNIITAEGGYLNVNLVFFLKKKLVASLLFIGSLILIAANFASWDFQKTVFQSKIEVEEHFWGRDYLQVARSLIDFAVLSKNHGDMDEALLLLAQAQQILGKKQNEVDPFTMARIQKEIENSFDVPKKKAVTTKN